MKSVHREALQAAAARSERRRQWTDRLTGVVIGMGGWSVMAAIVLIFFYLVFEVWPLFQGSRLEPVARPLPQQAAVWMDVDEHGHAGMRLTNHRLEFFSLPDGRVTGMQELPLPAGVSISSVVRGSVTSGLVGLGLSDGRIFVFRPEYRQQEDARGLRQVHPAVAFPFGMEPLTLDADGLPVRHFAIREKEDLLQVMGMSGGKLVWAEFLQTAEIGWAPGSVLSTLRVTLPFEGEPGPMVIGQDARWLYVFSGRDRVTVIRLQPGRVPVRVQSLALFDGQHEVTAVSALQGNVSLLVGDSSGNVSQWFMVREAAPAGEHFVLRRIRDFVLGDVPVTALAAETGRKGFLAGDAGGNVGYFFTTSGRTLNRLTAADSAIRALAIADDSSHVLVQSEHAAGLWRLQTAHPDMSWQMAWGKVWYESWPEPAEVWQSSSANEDYESKLSLLPLTFGTLKAAFYAMLVAVPLALCGAMYTAVFMAPALRRRVKPAIELMQALPTVILGFLAGLWLAPLVENHLPGIVSLLLVTPAVILLTGFLWLQLPAGRRATLPQGWAPLLLLLPVLLAGWLSFSLSQPVENWLFAGDARYWLETATGLRFDQRNALVIGVAMGFAIIAPVYSIAEDALHAVPRHLTQGSLALGATPWQTLVRVVLPTASPGIFSAIMIGFGRAVGETMIVLMATGNTPVLEWNIFEGMRTLSANVAVEMGEGEAGSTHFRMLFLSALLLFVLTFILNTMAELVRSRLRRKYGSL